MSDAVFRNEKGSRCAICDGWHEHEHVLPDDMVQGAQEKCSCEEALALRARVAELESQLAAYRAALDDVDGLCAIIGVDYPFPSIARGWVRWVLKAIRSRVEQAGGTPAVGLDVAWAKARRDALEEAARVCEARSDNVRGGAPPPSFSAAYRHLCNQGDELAEAIRALKEKP